MQSPNFSVRKPVFFLLNGLVVLLSASVFFLYRDKAAMQQQNRQLIIQNDSILSVNIVLADSLTQNHVLPAIQKSSFSKAETDE